MEWLSGLTDWFVVLFQGLWADALEFANDSWVGIFDQVLSLVASIVSSIPVPGFLSTYSLSVLFSSVPPEILYFVVLLRFSEAFAIIGAGVSFRMGRKVLTLFQW